jgi:hypothetical protein
MVCQKLVSIDMSIQKSVLKFSSLSPINEKKVENKIGVKREIIL